MVSNCMREYLSGEKRTAADGSGVVTMAKADGFLQCVDDGHFGYVERNLRGDLYRNGTLMLQYSRG